MDLKEGLKTLGKTVANFAPMLGTALLGPGGTAIGTIVASTFGGDIDKPEELEALIKADPQAVIKLKEIESNNKVELEKLVTQQAANILEADTARIASVNKSMQTEAASGDKWQRRWRPFWGFSTAGAFCLQILVIIYAVLFETAAAPGIIVALASLDVFWAVPLAILGVSAYHRGKEKRVLAGEDIKPLIQFGKK